MGRVVSRQFPQLGAETSAGSWGGPAAGAGIKVDRISRRSPPGLTSTRGTVAWPPQMTWLHSTG